MSVRNILWTVLVLSTFAWAEEPQSRIDTVEVTAEQLAEGIEAFGSVYTVLQHPRCLNCHPSGDAPLQTDDSTPHAMNVSRSSTDAGLQCSVCHQTQNSESYGIEGGPPGAPNWHLPEKEMPLVFEGRTALDLCLQLKDPEQNGHKTLDELYLHIARDPLVLWGWEPGGNRTKPELSHRKFSSQFKMWMDAGAPCPTELSKPAEK